MEAASRTELPSVRWPALRVLLELTWEEELMMRLIESNIADSWRSEFQWVQSLTSG